MKKVDAFLDRVLLRLRLTIIIRYAIRGFILSACIAITISLLSKFIHFLNLWYLPSGIILSGGFSGAVAGFMKKISRLDAAIIADHRCQTGEKISAFLESAQGVDGFTPLIESRAEECVKNLSTTKVVPYRVSGRWLYLILLFAIVTGVAFIPQYKYASEIAREKNRTELSETAKSLDKAVSFLEKTEETDPAVKELQKYIEELNLKLKRGEIDRKTAVAEIAKISDSLEKMLREKFEKKAETEETADSLAKSGETSPIAEAMKNMDKTRFEKEAESLEKRFEKLGEQIREETGEAKENAMKEFTELAESLNKSMEGLKSGESLEKLLSALDALSKTGDIEGFEGQISDEALKQLAENVAQDLKEMMDAGSLTEEDLNRMLNALKQVAKAKDQAIYGKEGSGGDVAGLTLQKDWDRLSESLKGSGRTRVKVDPTDFSGGDSTNLAGPKFEMKPGVTSDDLGTIAPNKATKFIEEYAAKLTEVDTQTGRIPGEMKPGEGISLIETRGAPETNIEISAEFEEVFQTLQRVAEDEVNRQTIPRKNREHVKKYFESLRQ